MLSSFIQIGSIDKKKSMMIAGFSSFCLFLQIAFRQECCRTVALKAIEAL